MSLRFVFAALALSCACAFAQPQRDTTVSPEVHPDRRVTFRIRAPKAAVVSLYGAWMPAGKLEPMTKEGDDGLWTLTVGPLEPTGYLYWFSVDGMTIADPINPNIKLRTRTSASLLEVPADPPALWEARDVPHGSVEVNWRKSKLIDGETRQIWVYLPPGYERNVKERYPILYLFHGSGDVAASWTQAGNANLIFDNLLADKKAVPMIVVMPFGHTVPANAPRELQGRNTERFEQYLLKEVMPWAEAKYRVAPGAQNRAIAGLSMGGGQAIAIGFRHLDLFSSIGAFSAAVGPDFESANKTALADSKGTLAKLRLFWIACGEQDSLLPRSQQLSELLNKHGIRHVFRATEGAHTWAIWRQYLSEFTPLLFRR